MVVPFEADHSYSMYCSRVMIAQNTIVHCAMLAVARCLHDDTVAWIMQQLRPLMAI